MAENCCVCNGIIDITINICKPFSADLEGMPKNIVGSGILNELCRCDNCLYVSANNKVLNGLDINVIDSPSYKSIFENDAFSNSEMNFLAFGLLLENALQYKNAAAAYKKAAWLFSRRESFDFEKTYRERSVFLLLKHINSVDFKESPDFGLLLTAVDSLRKLKKWDSAVSLANYAINKTNEIEIKDLLRLELKLCNLNVFDSIYLDEICRDDALSLKAASKEFLSVLDEREYIFNKPYGQMVDYFNDSTIIEVFDGLEVVIKAPLMKNLDEKLFVKYINEAYVYSTLNRVKVDIDGQLNEFMNKDESFATESNTFEEVCEEELTKKDINIENTKEETFVIQGVNFDNGITDSFENIENNQIETCSEKDYINDNVVEERQNDSSNDNCDVVEEICGDNTSLAEEVTDLERVDEEEITEIECNDNIDDIPFGEESDFDRDNTFKMVNELGEDLSEIIDTNDISDVNLITLVDFKLYGDEIDTNNEICKSEIDDKCHTTNVDKSAKIDDEPYGNNNSPEELNKLAGVLNSLQSEAKEKRALDKAMDEITINAKNTNTVKVDLVEQKSDDIIKNENIEISEIVRDATSNLTRTETSTISEDVSESYIFSEKNEINSVETNNEQNVSIVLRSRDLKLVVELAALEGSISVSDVMGIINCDRVIADALLSRLEIEGKLASVNSEIYRIV